MDHSEEPSAPVSPPREPPAGSRNKEPSQPGSGVAELEAHPRRDDLARLVRTVALSAADEHRARFGDGLDEALGEVDLTQADGEVGGFNVLKALTRSEPPIALGRELLGRLLARGIALDPPDSRVVAGVCWLAANTYLDALAFLDRELGVEPAARMWAGLAALVADADERGAPKGRGEALAAAAALAASPSAAAAEERTRLSATLRDPLLAALCRAPAAGEEGRRGEASLTGELVPVPLGPAGMVLWSATGLILVRYLLRFIANVLLRCRRPVELRVAGAGIRLQTELAVLGRTIRTREVHIPLANLSRAVREVRYPRLALYAGLVALGLGTFIGVSLATEGAIAGSPSLLGLGAGIFALGMAIDLVFASLLPSRRGQHRLILVPRSGRSWAIRVTDAAAADRALRVLGP